MSIRENWLAEKKSAYLYRVIAEVEDVEHYKKLFRQLSIEAESQADIWIEEARKAGELLSNDYRPNLQTYFVEKLIRWCKPKYIQSILSANKVRGVSVYSHSGEHPNYSSAHDVGHRHHSLMASNWLRAAIFGINDGIVSIACLVLGVAGATQDFHYVLLTGSAGLLAGAFSMGAGEYISVQSQREMFEKQIKLEREEIIKYPEEEIQELTLIYEARGMPHEEARTVAERMIANPEIGLMVLAREELGLNPEELGSAWVSAISSFAAFSVGGGVSLLPYLFHVKHYALAYSVTFSLMALFLVGMTLSLFTGMNALKSGLRMLFIGGIAGIVTYSLGTLMGAIAF